MTDISQEAADDMPSTFNQTLSVMFFFFFSAIDLMQLPRKSITGVSSRRLDSTEKRNNTSGNENRKQKQINVSNERSTTTEEDWLSCPATGNHAIVNIT